MNIIRIISHRVKHIILRYIVFHLPVLTITILDINHIVHSYHNTDTILCLHFVPLLASECHLHFYSSYFFASSSFSTSEINKSIASLIAYDLPILIFLQYVSNLLAVFPSILIVQTISLLFLPLGLPIKLITSHLILVYMNYTFGIT